MAAENRVDTFSASDDIKHVGTGLQGVCVGGGFRPELTHGTNLRLKLENTAGDTSKCLGVGGCNFLCSCQETRRITSQAAAAAAAAATAAALVSAPHFC